MQAVSFCLLAHLLPRDDTWARAVGSDQPAAEAQIAAQLSQRRCSQLFVLGFVEFSPPRRLAKEKGLCRVASVAGTVMGTQ